MAQVRWTLGAASDLEEIAEYLSGTSSINTSELVKSILDGVAGLESHPRMGRVVPEYQMERLRELIVRDYRVVYVLDSNDDSVRIYAIQHGSRDLIRRLGEHPWDT